MQHYKGKTSFTEVIEMPHRLFYSLYIRLVERLNTDEGKKNAAAEEVQDTVEEGLGI